MIAYKSNLDAVLRDFANLDAGIIVALKKGMRGGMERFKGHIQQRQMTGRPGLYVRHGNAGLRGSWYTQVIAEHGMDYGVLLGTRSRYAAIHQFGGTITPNNSQWLTIPLTPEAKRVSARNFGRKLFFFTSKSFKHFLVSKGDELTTTGGKIKLQYVLKKSVYIPKRLHVLESFKSEGFTVIRRAMWQSIAAEMKVRRFQGTSPNISL